MIFIYYLWKTEKEIDLPNDLYYLRTRSTKDKEILWNNYFLWNRQNIYDMFTEYKANIFFISQ